MSKTAVIYARVSVTHEDSVSVAQQLERCRRYAEARGWQVTGEFVDDGVSATKSRPEQRGAWKAIVETEHHFDVVIIWRVDRLARRVMDFLRADDALRARGAAITCVEQPIDMTTGEGRAFAQMLAVFGEMEASAISARMTAARAHLLQSGRVAAGPVPYGWRAVPNPAGPGLVLDRDPGRIDWVRGMARRVLAGDTVASVGRWLDDQEAPFPRQSTKARKTRRWHPSTIRRILENPLLAGMILHNPRNGRRGRLTDVLRGPDGRPVVRQHLAIISLAQRKRLLQILDQRSAAYDRGRALRQTLRPTLRELVTCGACERTLPMRHGVEAGRTFFKCPRCRQVISAQTLTAYVEQQLLANCGELVMTETLPTPLGAAPLEVRLERVELSLAETALELTLDYADVDGLQRQIVLLKDSRTRLRQALRKQQAQVRTLTMTVREVWARCATDDQRRAVMHEVLVKLTIYRGARGRFVDPDRIELVWKAGPALVAPQGITQQPPLPPKLEDYISYANAARLTGIDQHRLRCAVREGLIVQRKGANRGRPSLLRQTVLSFAETECSDPGLIDEAEACHADHG